MSLVVYYALLIGNVAMQVAPPGSARSTNYWPKFGTCKLRHLEAKFTTNASNTTWWPKLELIQVIPILSQTWNQYKWRHLQIDFCQKNDLSYRGYALGPLCLWQCFGSFCTGKKCEFSNNSSPIFLSYLFRFTIWTMFFSESPWHPVPFHPLNLTS